MNWRTDKPTADVIVAYVKLNSYPLVLRRPDTFYDYYYIDDMGDEIAIQNIEKWADLEEDETVTENNSLKEEVISYFQGYWPETETAEQCNTDMHFTPLAIMRLAEHFAKWGAEHTFTHHETDESLQEAVTHQMEDEQVIDDYVRRGLDDVVLKYAQLGAKWQREQLRDLCYQCEKDYDNVFYKGEQHAIKMLKEEAIEGKCIDIGMAGVVIDTDYGCLFLPQNTFKIGDKVKVIILKDGNED